MASEIHHSCHCLVLTPGPLLRCAARRVPAGYAALLEEEREAALPEFLRPRPKYYYYNQWMRRRIEEQVYGYPK